MPVSGPQSWRRMARLFVAGMLCLHVLFFAELRGRIERGYSDFTAFYTAGTLLRDGLRDRLYDVQVQHKVQESFTGRLASRQGPLPYIHPPFEALIFLPLSLLPYPQAFVVWDLMNVVALFGVAVLLRRFVTTLRLIPPWEFVTACLAFFPIFVCFLQGQDSILLLLLCTLGFNSLKKEVDLPAGGWFALGVFKFQWVIPIVLLLIVWKRKRVAIGFLAVSAVLMFVSLGLSGWESMIHYPAYILHIVQTPSLGGVPSELMPNLRGLVLGWSLPFSGTVENAAVVLGSVLLLVFTAIRGRASAQPGNLEMQFSLAIVVSGLIGWHTNAHDLSLLVLPLVLTTDYCLHRSPRQPGRRFVLLLPILPLLISPLWMVLWLAIGQMNLMAIPLLWWTWEMGKVLSDRWNFAARV
jgi:hypothetical protein